MTDKDGKYLEKVNVRLEPSGKSTTTDASGKFQFEVETGIYTLTFTKDGFLQKTESVEARAEETVNKDVILDFFVPFFDYPDKKEYTFESFGGIYQIAINTNVSWSAVSEVSWVKFNDGKSEIRGNETDKSIKIFCEPNQSGEMREGQITVTGKDCEKKIFFIKQTAASVKLIASEGQKDVLSSNGNFTFNIEANVDWTLSNKENWLRPEKSSGKEGLTDIFVNYDENTTFSPRTDTIVILGGGEKCVVLVKQAAKAAELKITPTSYNNVPASLAGSVDFSITSNLEWEAKSDKEWLILTQTTGIGSKNISANYSQNIEINNRVANITVSAKNGAASPVTATVTQVGAAAFLTVTDNTQEVDYTGGNVVFEVKSNIAWQAQCSDNWVNLTQRSGIGNGQIIAKVSANNEIYERNATISISGNNVPQITAIISQNQKPYLNVTNPTGNSKWLIGDNQRVTWKSNFSENVKIELFSNTNRGKKSVYVIANSAPNNESFEFKLPTNLLIKNDYFVKISSTTKPEIFAESQTFEIINTRNDTLVDYVGNHYKLVQIGSQIWMKENLKTTHYADGTLINEVYDYQNVHANATIYGKLYTWNAVMNGATTSNGNPSGVQGVCPTGFHVPSDNEWTQLVNSQGGIEIAGEKLKSTTGWQAPNTGATNESNFTALPAGMRFNSGNFDGLTKEGYFWTTTERDIYDAQLWYLYYDSGNANSSNDAKTSGYSVRCVKNTVKK